MIEEITATARGYIICSTTGIEEVFISVFHLFFARLRAMTWFLSVSWLNMSGSEPNFLLGVHHGVQILLLTKPVLFLGRFGYVFQLDESWHKIAGGHFGSRFRLVLWPLAFHVGFYTNIMFLMGQFAFHMTLGVISNIYLIWKSFQIKNKQSTKNHRFGATFLGVPVIFRCGSRVLRLWLVGECQILKVGVLPSCRGVKLNEVRDEFVWEMLGNSLSVIRCLLGSCWNVLSNRSLWWFCRIL